MQSKIGNTYPASNLFCMESHRSHTKEIGSFQFRESVDQIFLSKMVNIFTINTYWFNF
jgi:hypothetical protein